MSNPTFSLKGSQALRPQQRSSSTLPTPALPVQPELAEESRVAPGSRLPSHALDTVAKVAGRQGAAPPGGSVAAGEREEGASVESPAGKVPDLSWEV